MRVYRNYQDPHHLNSGAKKKKEKKEEEEEKNQHDSEKDIIHTEKDESEIKVQKTKINGHEWLTFKNLDSDTDEDKPKKNNTEI